MTLLGLSLMVKPMTDGPTTPGGSPIGCAERPPPDDLSALRRDLAELASLVAVQAEMLEAQGAQIAGLELDLSNVSEAAIERDARLARYVGGPDAVALVLAPMEPAS